jgi:hypothetical protein
MDDVEIAGLRRRKRELTGRQILERKSALVVGDDGLSDPRLAAPERHAGLTDRATRIRGDQHPGDEALAGRRLHSWRCRIARPLARRRLRREDDGKTCAKNDCDRWRTPV